jgi:xylulose-5-phosphate/fructose-6-phosphate phosphoketolase
LELAIENKIDRFTLAMDVVKYVPRLQQIGSSALSRFLNQQIACRNYAFEHGTDRPDVAGWKWPHEKTRKAA